MIVYSLATIFAVVIMGIGEKVQKKYLKYILYFLSSLPIWFITAFRYNVGTDYINTYTNAFNSQIANGMSLRLERGFSLLIAFCLKFTQNPMCLFVVTSIIIISLIWITIIFKSKNKMLSIVIFVLGGFFFESLNIMRQYIAISLVICGYMFLIKDMKFFLNYIIYVLFLGVAFFFHESSLVAISLIFLKKKNFVKWFWVIPSMFLIIIFREKIMSILHYLLKMTKYGAYFQGKFAKGEISVINIFINLVYYLFYTFIYIKLKKKKETTDEITLFVNVQGMALIFVCISSCHCCFLDLRFILKYSKYCHFHYF